tara:strand:+ start:16353 stop:16685 length:333 start_codon:yes stop_codon:yes gene_type:complete
MITQKIGLIATHIIFNNRYTLTYKVKTSRVINELELNHVPFCGNDIKGKELILLPTLITKDNLEVSFTCSNVSPTFYQGILNGSLHNIDELKVEIDNIYLIDEIVGYILL